MKKVLILVVAPVVAAVMGTGCSRSSKEPANTVHIPSIAKIKTLDPILADDMYSGYEVGKVYENLLHYAYLKRPYALEPQLAESMPTMSKDKKTYTFHLKKGVLFQDDSCFPGGKGREMTADDVIYSLKRIADPKNNSSGWWTLDGKVAGLNDWRAEATKSGVSDYSKPIAGLKAVDRYTVQITLTQPSYQFLFSMAMPFESIVPHEAVEKYGQNFVNHPVGTGPFRLTEWVPGSRLVWDRNPTYRTELYPSEGAAGDKEAGLLKDAGQRLPRADRIVTEIFEEQQPMWLNFMSGKLDVSPVPKDNYGSAIGPNHELVPALKSKRMRLVRVPMIDLTYTSFNMDDPILGKNRLLRQAISMADDQSTLDQRFYNGEALPAQGPIPPGLQGYDPKYKDPYRQYNLAKAKELLAKAGYPGGRGLPVFEIAALADSDNRQMTDYFIREMAALGITIRANTGSWPQFDEAIKNKRGQFWSLAWGPDYPDAEDYLALYYSKNASPGSNDSNYRNPAYDKLYEAALKLPDGAARTALYRKMAAIVIEDCPRIWGAHRMQIDVVQPWMKNFKYNDMSHDQFTYYGVDPSVKK